MSKLYEDPPFNPKDLKKSRSKKKKNITLTPKTTDVIKLRRLGEEKKKAKENISEILLKETENELKKIYSDFYGILPENIVISDEGGKKLKEMADAVVDRYFITIGKYDIVKIKKDTYADKEFEKEREKEIKRVKGLKLKEYRSVLTMTNYSNFSKFIGAVLKKRVTKYVDEKVKYVKEGTEIKPKVTKKEKEYGTDLQFLTHIREAFGLKDAKLDELIKQADLIKQCFVLYKAMFDSGYLEEGVSDVFGRQEEPKNTKLLFDSIGYNPTETNLYTKYYRKTPGIDRIIMIIKNEINNYLLDKLAELKKEKKLHRLVFNMAHKKIDFNDMFIMLFGEMYFIHKVTSMFKVSEFKKKEGDVEYYEFLLSGENNMVDVRNEIINIKKEIELYNLRRELKSMKLKSTKKTSKISSKIGSEIEFHKYEVDDDDFMTYKNFESSIGGKLDSEDDELPFTKNIDIDITDDDDDDEEDFTM